jgi:C4-dicarboxylate-specific signal transduction histidine kinase
LNQDTGIAGKVLKTKRTIWINAEEFAAQSPFNSTYRQLKIVSAVGVPIIIHGELFAILQFLSTNQIENQESLLRFFDILGLQLANVIERQQSQAREKQHFADLAMSSKLVTLGEMAAGVAHEINNPLSIIVMGAEKLERLQTQATKEPGSNDSNALAINLLSRIRLAAGRITKIVAGLRTFSRDGRNDAFTKAQLSQIVEDTLALCQSRFEQTKVRLEVCEIPKDWFIDCQAVQISQALLNLLNNALDAALETETPWVELDFSEHHGQVEISVTDSGKGIPHNLMEKIMRPFFTTKPVGKGTGLGLSISSSILTSHGGSLRLDQDHPHTRFIMRLPKSNIVR